MKLYLLRHGIATERVGGAILNDSQRPLTEEGKAETKLVAMGLKRLNIKPGAVITSPLVRARQTAEIICDVLGSKDDLKVANALAPGGVASDLYKFLRHADRLQSLQEVFLVGHEPDMGRLVGTLLWAGPELDIPFKKAGVCRIDIHDVPPTVPGTLKWFLTPKIACLIASK